MRGNFKGTMLVLIVGVILLPMSPVLGLLAMFGIAKLMSTDFFLPKGPNPYIEYRKWVKQREEEMDQKK